MADVSINTLQRYSLNGVEINAAEEWKQVRILAEYENDSIQPQLTIDSFTFNQQARNLILQWIRDGNIFEGMPFQITLFNNKPVLETFESFLNFTQGYRELPDDGKVVVNLEKENSIESFFDKIETISYGYLESIGVIGDGDYIDLDYVVEKKIQPLEILISSVVIYLLLKEIAESVQRIADTIAQISAYAASGITGSLGAALYAAASAIIEIAYTATLVAAVINLANDLINTLVPPRRTHKVFPYISMLRKVCQYYGYGFSTSVSIFNNLVNLPSNQNLDIPDKLGFIKEPQGTNKGIPNPNDRGYIVSEFFELCKEFCDGKFAIIDNVVHLRPKDDPFWIRNSQYKRRDSLITTKEYNVDELNSTVVLEFATDISDDYTIDNFGGTVIEIKTDLINTQNENNVLLNGIQRVPFGVALGSRKNELNALENLLKTLGGTVDQLTNIFGKPTNFANRIKTRVGLLKTSTNNHAVSKAIYLNGSSMPRNHRDLFSAPVLWNLYYGDTSFVRNNFRGQKAIYRNVETAFGLEDYKLLTENSYFQDENGNEAKIIKFEWEMENDKAFIDYWVREVYTKNLREITIIP